MNKKRIIISFIVLLVIINIVLITPLGKSITAFVVDKVNEGVIFVRTQSENIGDYFNSVKKANKEARILKQEKSNQQTQIDNLAGQNDVLSADNKALQAQLNGNNQTITMMNSYGINTQVINGVIVNRNINQWNNVVNVKIEDVSRIHVGLPVINNGVLVGFVKSVNGNNIDVQLLSLANKTLNIPVMVINNNQEINCIIRSYNPDTNEFLIETLNSGELLNENSSVYTNGYQPNVAKGILVGTIVGPQANNETGQTLYRIKAPINFGNVRYVGVVVNA